MCEHGRERVVELPPHIHPEKEVRTVSLDLCISWILESLWWENDVQTLGSCCGHSKEDPSIVIPIDTDEKEIQRIVSLLQFDTRNWKIFQWRLTEAANTQRSSGEIALKLPASSA